MKTLAVRAKYYKRLLVFVCFARLLSSAVTRAENSSDFEELKRFLDDTPRIDEIAFVLIPTPSYNIEGTNVVQTPPNIGFTITAGWSPSSAWIATTRNIRTVHPKKNSIIETLVFHNNTEFAACLKTPPRLIEWKGQPTEQVDLKNPVLAQYDADSLRLNAALCMGPHHIPPRTIHWSGNDFQCVTKTATGDEWRVSGTIFEDSSHRASSMRVTYKGPGIDGRLTFQYSYDGDRQNLPSFIPTTVYGTFRDGDKEQLERQIRFSRVKIADLESASKPFAANDWFKNALFERQIFTNNELFAVQASGTLLKIDRNLPNTNAPSQLAVNRYYYAGCALLCAYFLMVNKSMRKKEHQWKTTNQREG